MVIHQVAGAPRVTVDGGENTGSVKVFKWNGQVWYQLGDNIDGESKSNQSGFSLSLSSNGSRIAIGALTNETEEGNKGHVRIYDWNGESWKKVGPDIDNMNKMVDLVILLVSLEMAKELLLLQIQMAKELMSMKFLNLLTLK